MSPARRKKKTQLSRATLSLDRMRAAPVTSLVCAAALVLSLGCLNARARTWEAYARWGYLSGGAVWSGKYWGLLSSPLVHVDPLHLVLNLYWMWRLGSELEPLMGRAKHLEFAGLLLLSAFVSSALQLGVGGETGLGLSGVVYAVFGYAWARGRSEPELKAVADPRTIRLFVAWLFIALALTALKVLNIGNAAHFSGLALGFSLGSVRARCSPTERAISAAALALLTMAAIVCSFWAPWSELWLSTKAYEAARQQRPADAIFYYSRILSKNAANSWAWQGRSAAKALSGDPLGARADWDAARKVEPSLPARP